MNGQTDGRWKNKSRTLCVPTSLDKTSVRIKTVYVGWRILRSCFYDAEHVLPAIAKFLVHLLWEGEGWAEMSEGRDRGTEWGKRGGWYGGAGNGNVRKNIPKTHFGDDPCSVILSSSFTNNFRKLFSGQRHFHRRYTGWLKLKYPTGQNAICRQPCEIFIPKFLGLYGRDPATILKLKKNILLFSKVMAM